MQRFNAVIVGYGYAGRAFHETLIRLVDGLEVYGVVSGREEIRKTLETEKGIKTYSELDEALGDPQTDLIVLATPNDTHAEYAIRSLEAGKHVVVDKPMALDLAEARSMQKAAQKNGCLLSIFQNRRWDGDFLTIKHLVDSGRLGNVLHAELAWHQCKPPRTWRTDRKHGGGKFLDLASHMIDQTLLLFPGEIESVFARFQKGMWENDVEDHSHCILTFKNGPDVHIDVSSFSRCPKPRWYLLGTKASLCKYGLDPQEKAMNAGDIDGACESPENYARIYTGLEGEIKEEVVETEPGRWRSYYENIAAVLRGQEDLAVTAESVCKTVAVLDAAQQSAETGKPVTPIMA